MTPPARAARGICVVGFVATLVGAVVAQTAMLTDYKPSEQVSGTIRVCGSPQMADLLRRYERGFTKLQPAVRFDVDLKSTVTAVAGIYSDRAEIGLLGREIWPAEVQAFEAREGHPPTVIDVATGSYDVPKATFALMIFVPSANPLASLSSGQLERIFAASDHPIRTWGELGLKGNWAARPIHLYGFSVQNDKSQIFSQLVFSKGEHWNSELKEFSNGTRPGGPDAGDLIVQAVANDPNAIGISNIHYSTPAVKALSLSIAEHPTPIAPTRENVADRSYPLTRAVYLVLNNDAAHPPSSAVIEFLRFVLSRQGQEAVVEEGNYLPLTSAIALRQLRHLPTPPRP